MIVQLRFCTSLLVPLLAWSGFFQSASFASSKTGATDRTTPAQILQNHVGIQNTGPRNQQASNLLSLSPEQVEVLPFQPDCQSNDQSCTVWSEFRRPYPYPTQRIAAKIVNDEEMILVISEPPNNLDKQQWRRLIESTFKRDLLEYQTFKWMIGVDGWVEDIVLRVKKPDVEQEEDLLNDRLTRDRIALLNIAMFGSSLGATIEPIDANGSMQNLVKIPNLRLSADEVLGWVTDRQIDWQPLNTSATPSSHWLEESATGTRQVMVSADKTLVLLTFPLSDILAARQRGALPEDLKVAFREFVVSSDIILSGAWSDQQVAIVARARQVPVTDFPPLRVETFELLAAQKTTELAQSYERTNLFAGKLFTGEYELRDWAPIYLSPALINTELGGLLNITDQMLKSWSMAGKVEYLYFDYPLKPNRFPFNGVPLSEVVFEETGSPQVLFNWNTTGMGSVISGEPSILIPTQTGALPVTYGSELEQGGEIETGHLQRYEEEAYDYFANLQDPSLATVVQYTLLYQLMLAAAPLQSSEFTSEANGGAQVLDDYALNFIRILDTATESDLADARELLSTFRADHPDIDDSQLAALLANPRTGRAQFLDGFDQDFALLSDLDNSLSERITAYIELFAEIDARDKRLQAEVNQFNREVDRLNRQGGASPSESARMEEWRASIIATENELAALSATLGQRQTEIEQIQQRQANISQSIDQAAAGINALLTQVQPLVAQLKESVYLVNELDEVRLAFSNAHSVSANSWIKTPASVLSWQRERGSVSLFSVGGHNLDSQTLRFEENPGISSLQVVDTPSGQVLQYPPNQRSGVLSNASELSRQIEHRGITDPQVLSRTIQGPGNIRPRREALAMSQSPAPEIGRPVSNNVELVSELQGLVEMNGCCRFVANDADGVAYLASMNPSPPPPVRISSYGDTPSLLNALDTRFRSPLDSNEPIVLLGDTGRADAIARSLRANTQQSASLLGRMPWLTKLAEIVNLPIGPVPRQPKSVTVLKYRGNNRLDSLQVSLTDQANPAISVNQVVDGLSARIQPNTAGVREVPNPGLDLNLPSRWQQAANEGKLAVINFSYAEQGPLGTSTNVYFSSLVNEPAQVPTARTEMVNVTNSFIDTSLTQETPTFDALTDIRQQIEEQLKLLSDDQVDMLLERKLDTYYITDDNHSNDNS
ncbi:MAG: hypothetical protein AAF821_07720 [Cyanobacteria bacterium P01_D01_bin.156]